MAITPIDFDDLTPEEQEALIRKIEYLSNLEMSPQFFIWRKADAPQNMNNPDSQFPVYDSWNSIGFIGDHPDWILG